MRNRAKCKLCESVIESFHRYDFVTCKCGEISVDGGQEYFRCLAGNWDNFLRVDDEGNIVIPEIEEAPTKEEENSTIREKVVELVQDSKTMSRDELIQELDRMILRFEQLPQEAMITPITHWDHSALMMLISAILKAK